MSGISSIRRDWGDNVSIVRIITSDSLASASAANYILNQAANISAANNGAFQWFTNDSVLVSASDGNELFNISADFSTLVPLNAVNQIIQRVTAAQWNGMYATPILLVPAPGANKILIVNKLILAMTFNSAQYAAGGAVGVEYDNVAHAAGVSASATLAAATVNGLAASTVEELAGVASVVYSGAVNKGLYLSNATGAFTTGDSNWVVALHYSVIPTV